MENLQKKRKNKKTPKVRVTQPFILMTQPVPTQQLVAQPVYQSQHNMMTPYQ